MRAPDRCWGLMKTRSPRLKRELVSVYASSLIEIWRCVEFMFHPARGTFYRHRNIGRGARRLRQLRQRSGVTSPFFWIQHSDWRPHTSAAEVNTSQGGRSPTLFLRPFHHRSPPRHCPNLIGRTRDRCHFKAYCLRKHTLIGLAHIADDFHRDHEQMIDEGFVIGAKNVRPFVALPFASNVFNPAASGRTRVTANWGSARGT